jgi:hypothetical protein
MRWIHAFIQISDVEKEIDVCRGDAAKLIVGLIALKIGSFP